MAHEGGEEHCNQTCKDQSKDEFNQPLSLNIDPSSILHRPFISPRPPQDRPKTTQRPRQDRPLKKYRFFIKNIDFSLEKCRFGAKKGVSHYVLRRKRVIFQKNTNFELEICVKPRGGRAARCMGTPPVAEMLASEARRDRPRGHVRARQPRVRRPLSMPFPGRDLATPSNKPTGASETCQDPQFSS